MADHLERGGSLLVARAPGNRGLEHARNPGAGRAIDAAAAVVGLAVHHLHRRSGGLRDPQVQRTRRRLRAPAERARISVRWHGPRRGQPARARASAARRRVSGDHPLDRGRAEREADRDGKRWRTPGPRPQALGPMSSVVIHGHFYQPPREDPFLDEVESEPSAAPFHDWNQRIERECYRAVVAARVAGSDGRIARLVNTLESISFNFGPTLLEWMEREARATYEAVLD